MWHTPAAPSTASCRHSHRPQPFFVSDTITESTLKRCPRRAELSPSPPTSSHVLHAASQGMTLKAGDVTATGTLSDVAQGMTPPARSKHGAVRLESRDARAHAVAGDVVEVSVVGIGRCAVMQESNSFPSLAALVFTPCVTSAECCSKLSAPRPRRAAAAHGSSCRTRRSRSC